MSLPTGTALLAGKAYASSGYTVQQIGDYFGKQTHELARSFKQTLKRGERQ